MQHHQRVIVNRSFMYSRVKIIRVEAILFIAFFRYSVCPQTNSIFAQVE